MAKNADKITKKALRGRRTFPFQEGSVQKRVDDAFGCSILPGRAEGSLYFASLEGVECDTNEPLRKGLPGGLPFLKKEPEASIALISAVVHSQRGK